MIKLPELTIGYKIDRKKLRQWCMKHLFPIADEEKFCMIRIHTEATPFPYGNVVPRSYGIGHATRFTSLAALRRATAILSEEAVHFGWIFEFPSFQGRGSSDSLACTPVLPEVQEAYNEFLDIIDHEHDPQWDGMEEGCEVRVGIYESYAHNPSEYALGIRVQQFTEKGKELIAAHN